MVQGAYAAVASTPTRAGRCVPSPWAAARLQASLTNVLMGVAELLDNPGGCCCPRGAVLVKPSCTDAGSVAGLAEHVREVCRVAPLLAMAFQANPADGRGWPQRARECSWYLMVLARAVVPAAIGRTPNN